MYPIVNRQAVLAVAPVGRLHVDHFKNDQCSHIGPSSGKSLCGSAPNRPDGLSSCAHARTAPTPSSATVISSERSYCLVGGAS
jgi:hypothetical protein